MRNENVSKENISTKQILQERESVKNISKENRIEFFERKCYTGFGEITEIGDRSAAKVWRYSEPSASCIGDTSADADSRPGGSVCTICGTDRL